MNPFNQTLRNFTIKIIVLVISLIVSLFIPAILGPGLFGLYSLIIVWVGFFIPVTSLGIGAGIVYFISNKSHDFQTVFSSNVFIAFVVGLINVFLLAVLKISGLILSIDPNLNYSNLALLMGSVFFQSFIFIIGRAWLGHSDYDKLNRIDIITSLLNPLVLLFIFCLSTSGDSTFIYVSYFLFSLILFGLHCMLLRHEMNWSKVQVPYLRSAFSYGMKSWYGDIALRANLRFDQLVLGSFISLPALGIYGVAVRLVELIWIIPDTIGPVLFNLIAGNQNREVKIELTTRIHRLVFFFCTVLLIIWLLCCKYFIMPFILGKEYADVIQLMMWLSPGVLILISSKIITKLFSASGHVAWTSRITIFGSIISILAYLFLIPSLGSTGAAIASSLGYICLAVAAVYVMKKNYKVPLSEFYLIQKSDIYWMINRVSNLLKKPGHSA